MTDVDQRGADLSDPLTDYVVPDETHQVPGPRPRAPGSSWTRRSSTVASSRATPTSTSRTTAGRSAPTSASRTSPGSSCVRMLEMNDEYRQVWVGAWLDEAEECFGRAERLEIEWLAWRDGMAPKLEAMLREYLPRRVRRRPRSPPPTSAASSATARRATTWRIDYAGPFAPGSGHGRARQGGARRRSCWAATSTSSSATRASRCRSWSGTASTTCSPSRGTSGAPRSCPR